MFKKFLFVILLCCFYSTLLLGAEAQDEAWLMAREDFMPGIAPEQMAQTREINQKMTIEAMTCFEEMKELKKLFDDKTLFVISNRLIRTIHDDPEPYERARTRFGEIIIDFMKFRKASISLTRKFLIPSVAEVVVQMEGLVYAVPAWKLLLELEECKEIIEAGGFLSAEERTRFLRVFPEIKVSEYVTLINGDEIYADIESAPSFLQNYLRGLYVFCLRSFERDERLSEDERRSLESRLNIHEDNGDGCDGEEVMCGPCNGFCCDSGASKTDRG
jgi:hypothetical protein